MIYLKETGINIMAIDATFWVAVSFIIFFGGLIYLKVPQKINEILNKLISDIKNEIDESEKLRTEAKTLLDNAQKKLDTAQSVSKEILAQAKKDSDNLIIELWDNYIDDEAAFDELIEEQKNKRVIDIEGAHYHGAFWKIDESMDEDEIDEATYTQLDSQYSNLNCVYITDVEADAEFFNTYNQEREDRENPLVIPIVFKTNVSISDVFNIEPLSTTLYYQNNEYSVQADREEYFEDLSPNYRGINIDNNYENGGRDIAIFDESDVNNGIEGIKIKINDEWTDYLPPEEAKELYINYCKEIMSSKLDNDIGKFAKKDTSQEIAKPKRQGI